MEFTVFCRGAMLAIALLTGGVTSASAQDQCESLARMASQKSDTFTFSLDENFACLVAKIEALSAENTALSDQISTLRDSKTPSIEIPSGAVVAFDLPAGCPTGWADVDEGWRGKSIVAAVQSANDRYAFGRTGGAETHTLSASEMPRHGHAFDDVFYSQSPETTTLQGVRHVPVPLNRGVSGGPDNNNAGFVRPAITSTAGDGQPHNNMPPYIALYYCKKE